MYLYSVATRGPVANLVILGNRPRSSEQVLSSGYTLTTLSLQALHPCAKGVVGPWMLGLFFLHPCAKGAIPEPAGKGSLDPGYV